MRVFDTWATYGRFVVAYFGENCRTLTLLTSKTSQKGVKIRQKRAIARSRTDYKAFLHKPL